MDLTWLQIGGALRTQLYLYHCYWISQRKPPEGLRKFYLIESYLKFIRLQGFPKLVSAGSVCKTHRTARAQLWGWKLTSWKHSDAESLKCILITNNQHRDSFFLAAYFSYPILKILKSLGSTVHRDSADHGVHMKWCLKFPTYCQVQLCQEFWWWAPRRIYKHIVFTVFGWGHIVQKAQ